MSLEHDGLGQLSEERLADDLLRGAPAIADFLGTTEAAVYHVHRKKQLPIGKLGKTLIAFRSELRRAALALVAAPKEAEGGARTQEKNRGVLAVYPDAVLALRGRVAWAHDWVSDPTLNRPTAKSLRGMPQLDEAAGRAARLSDRHWHRRLSARPQSSIQPGALAAQMNLTS